MTHTGAGTGGIPRLGERPAQEGSSGCATCRHPYAMHSNGKTGCKAFACTAGPRTDELPGGSPCQAFAEPAGAPGQQRAAS